MNGYQITLSVVMLAFIAWAYRWMIQQETEADRYHPDMQHHGDREPDDQTARDLALVVQERRFREAETRGLGANTKTPALYRPVVSGPQDDTPNLLSYFRGQQS